MSLTVNTSSTAATSGDLTYNNVSNTFHYDPAWTSVTVWPQFTVSPPTKEKRRMAFTAKKFAVVANDGDLVGLYDSLDDAQEAAEQHAEAESERAFVLKPIRVVKPSRRDVKTEEV